MTDQRKSYYLDDYTDEVLPITDLSLVGWAAWLADVDSDWHRDEPANDGDTFAAHALVWQDDIVATRTPDGWSLDRDPGNADFLAVRFGQGLGWTEDNIVYDDDMCQALLDWLRDNDGDCNDVEYVAVGVEEPNLLVTYHAGITPTLTVETVQ